MLIICFVDVFCSSENVTCPKEALVPLTDEAQGFMGGVCVCGSFGSSLRTFYSALTLMRTRRVWRWNFILVFIFRLLDYDYRLVLYCIVSTRLFIVFMCELWDNKIFFFINVFWNLSQVLFFFFPSVLWKLISRHQEYEFSKDKNTYLCKYSISGVN